MVTAVPCISCRGTDETPLTGMVGAHRTLNASFKFQMWSFSEDKYWRATSRQFAWGDSVARLNRNRAQIANNRKGSQVELRCMNCLNLCRY